MELSYLDMLNPSECWHSVNSTSELILEPQVSYADT